jgi:hypothetical protein
VLSACDLQDVLTWAGKLNYKEPLPGQVTLHEHEMPRRAAAQEGEMMGLREKHRNPFLDVPLNEEAQQEEECVSTSLTRGQHSRAGGDGDGDCTRGLEAHISVN